MMIAKAQTYNLWVGIDISLRSAVVAWVSPTQHSHRSFKISQTKVGFQRLRNRLLALEPEPRKTLVVIEVGGNYWLALATQLHQYGFVVCAINPVQARRFAQAQLQKAKTDAIDAQVLAQLGATLALRRWTPPPPIHGELQQRLQQRQRLVEMRTKTLNRQKAYAHHPEPVAQVLERTEQLQALLLSQIRQIDKELHMVLQQEPEWAATAQCLLSIKCLGIVTVAWLLVLTVNFTACDSAEQLVSYVGLAPYVRQSGASLKSFRRTGGGGHKQLRQLLYMAALAGIRTNPTFKRTFDRLKTGGKPGKVAVIAVCRKLLHVAFAVATKREMFNPNAGR